jgi:hypothetical protein
MKMPSGENGLKKDLVNFPIKIPTLKAVEK